MPTNRTPIGRKSVLKITPEAIGAWKRADFDALHRLLGLAPWEASPLPYEITALGCSENDLPVEPGSRDWEKSIPKAVALQRQFLAVASWPDCREIYEEELRDAEKTVAYYRELVEHPDRGGQGTGSDPESRRKRLVEAEATLRYRQRLLDELETVREKWAPRSSLT
jgi:hypothetical protein